MAPAHTHENSLRAGPPPQLASRERLAVWGGITAVTAVSWLALACLPIPGNMSDGAGAVMASAMGPGATMWPLHDAWLIFVMWTIMMAAMMLPSASPMIAMYARIARGRAAGRIWHVWLFLAGYLMAWAAFSAAITAVQYPLESTRIIGDAMRIGPLAGGLLLIATGIYQLTPLKEACLSQCRSPLGFFMTKWRPGGRGAFAMGLDHGVFCVGCCWLLMALMFVAGAMNLLWTVALTIFVLLEKAAPRGDIFARVSGVAMIVSGVALAAVG
jgi:predicted metal-binding membrane protein